MIRIKLLLNTSFGYRGEVVSVTRNEAHTLIDQGKGEIFVVSKPTPIYRDKMLRGKK